MRGFEVGLAGGLVGVHLKDGEVVRALLFEDGVQRQDAGLFLYGGLYSFFQQRLAAGQHRRQEWAED